jgi:hypothetical protein
MPIPILRHMLAGVGGAEALRAQARDPLRQWRRVGATMPQAKHKMKGE